MLSLALAAALGARMDAVRPRGPGGPPVLLAPPTLAGESANGATPIGAATIGVALRVDPGRWSGAARLALQWRRDGQPVPGAEGATYRPVAADDGARLDCRVTAENAAGRAVALTAPLVAVHAAPSARGALGDRVIPASSGVYRMDTSSDFSGASLRFQVDGEGVSIDPATGQLSIATDRLSAGIVVTVTATNSGGSAVSRFRLSIVTERAPVLVAAPALAGAVATIGTAVAADPGRWDGTPTPELALQWLLDGAAIPGATGAQYAPAAADDGGALALRVTARNAAGEAVATSPALPVVHVAPAATGGLADLVLDAGAEPGRVPAAAAFAGAALTFAVNGRGATIDSATGVVTIATDGLFDRERITVTASNSGGSATSGFLATVRAVAPANLAAPALAGAAATATIGTEVTLDPGRWSGAPVPALEVAWLLDGAPVAGATGLAYTPAAGDDGKALAARVTASNAAGSVSATSAAYRVVQVAPAVVDRLTDIGAEQGASLVVEAATAFAGAALAYGVAGGIAGGMATIDAATGRVVVPTGTVGEGTITVTATNSGGSASASFLARVTAKPVTGEIPAVVTAPSLSGTARIGRTLTLNPGTWSGNPTPALAQQWLRAGTPISGATALTYTLGAADDGRAIRALVTATNSAGSASASTKALAASYPAPRAAGGLAAQVFDAGSGPQTVATAGDFTGEAMSFAVTGAGATIDAATGVVTIPTDALVAETVTVTASNSGGSATSGFLATVRAVAPANLAAPALAGEAATATIGTEVALDPGRWSGAPAPALEAAWLLDGAPVAGATGLAYTPAAGDDGKALAARVTASNAAGSVSATSAARRVVQVAPAAVAPLADVAAEQDAGLVVEAAAAFLGAALTFAVTGGIGGGIGAGAATIDAATGRVVVPTGTVGEGTVTVTATNSGGSASASFLARVTAKPVVTVLPAAVTAPSLSGTPRIGQTLTVDPGTWSGVPAPTIGVEWLRAGTVITGATALSYTPVAADDGRAVRARVTATNVAGSTAVLTAALRVTYPAPVAKGALVEEIFDVGSGPQTVATAGDFTGQALSFAVTGVGATIDAATGVVTIPTDTAASGLVTVTATNSGGSASSSFQVTVEAEDIPFALEADDIEVVQSVWRPEGQTQWFTPVLRFPGLAGETVHAVEWTTAAADQPTDGQFEVAARSGDGWQLYMRDPAKNAPGATPRVDYSVWSSGEARRDAVRLRWKRTAEGPWSGPSPRITVPEPAATGWLPLIHRTREQFDAKTVGGGGFQYFRSWGYSPAKPDRLFGVQDISIPIRTENFGAWWESAPCVGLRVGISGQGCAIDSQDGDRILVMYSASSRRFIKGWNDQSGIYLSTDGGDSFTLVRQLDDIAGSAESSTGEQPGSRFMQFPFVEVPGGTAETRRWYAFQRKVAKGQPAADGALWRSTDGGRSWATSGEALTVSKFGDNFYVMRRALNGDFYFGCSKGLFRSTNEGGSWTRLASLAAGAVLEIDVKGATGEVWAAVDGVGLYRSTDHGASWTARKTGYDMQSFAISPHDRNRILIAGSNTPKRMVPQISLNGGSSWTNVVTDPFPGQPEEFQSLIQGSHAYYIFHATDPNKVFCARFQHFGTSTDGGRTFVWASNNFDYNFVHDIAVDPGDWTQMALAMQDRMLVFTANGHDWIWDDAIGEAIKDEIATQAGYTGHTGAGRGALILRNGSQRRIISGGGNNSRRVTIIHETVGENPIGGCRVPDHKGEVSWCLLGANDVADASRGYLGRWRYDLAANGTLTGPVDVTYEVMGVGKDAGLVFAVDKSSGETIRRSTDYGATWSVWGTAPEAFRPIDNEPMMVFDRSSAGRALMVGATGKGYLAEGASRAAFRQVFDLRAQIGSGFPAYELYHCALDSRNPDVAYITANVYGGPVIFRSLNLTAAQPVWEDLSAGAPHNPCRVYIHPATGEVIVSYHHGSMIHPAPAGYRERFAITPTLYGRVGAFPGIRQ